jgi:hypothetical protein|tara:strand:+ start:899 stop:1498 length:600 start_codon:yes stop_codon:yes gene_type:complete
MKAIQNYYYLYINSDDNADANVNCKNINFNLSSILQSAPNKQFIEDQAYCYVKLSYFAIDLAPDATAIGTTTTIQIRLGGTIFPNTFETTPLTAGNPATGKKGNHHNLVSSNILGVIPTGREDATDFNSLYLYSNQYYDNTYVVMGNPFKGQLNIQLTDQDGTILADTLTNNKSYNMKLEIYFPEDEQFIFNNNKNLIN